MVEKTLFLNFENSEFALKVFCAKQYKPTDKTTSRAIHSDEHWKQESKRTFICFVEKKKW